MTDITKMFIPQDIWSLITADIDVLSASTLKQTSKYFNDPDIQKAIWAQSISRLQAMDKSIVCDDFNIKNIQKIFIDGFKKIRARQKAEIDFIVKSGLWGRPEYASLPYGKLTTLEAVESLHQQLEELNFKKIDEQLFIVYFNQPLSDQVEYITRLPEKLKQDPVQLLLFIESKQFYGKTPLHVASTLDYLKDLIAHGGASLVNAQDASGATPLHKHVQIHAPDALEKIECLVKHGANVNAKNIQGTTPLHLAFYTDDALKKIQCLVELGADVNLRDHRGFTPLHIATECGPNTMEKIKCLVEHGADVHAKIPYNYQNSTVLAGIYDAKSLLYFLALPMVKNHPDTGRILAGNNNNKFQIMKYMALALSEQKEDAKTVVLELIKYPEVFDKLSYVEQLSFTIKPILNNFSSTFRDYIYKHPDNNNDKQPKPNNR